MPAKQQSQVQKVDDRRQGEEDLELEDFGSNMDKEMKIQGDDDGDDTPVLDQVIRSTDLSDPNQQTPEGPNFYQQHLDELQRKKDSKPQIVSTDLSDPKSVVPDGLNSVELDLKEKREQRERLQPIVSTDLSDPNSKAPEPQRSEFTPLWAKDVDDRDTLLSGLKDPKDGDERARLFGLDVERQGFFLPEKVDEFQSKTHKDINEKNLEQSTDERYQRRIFKEDKTFEDHAQKEKQRSDGVRSPKALETLRKVVVRANRAIDNHADEVMTVEAMVFGAVAELKIKRDEQSEALASQVKTSKEEDGDSSYGWALQQARDIALRYETWRATGGQLKVGANQVRQAGDHADIVSIGIDRVEKDFLAKRENGEDTKPLDTEIDALQKAGDKVLVDRTEAKRQANAAEQVKGRLEEEGLHDSGFWTKLGRGTEKVGVGVLAALVESTSMGMFTVDRREVEGGRKTRIGMNLTAPLDNYKLAKAQADQIRERGVMGEGKASAIYAWFKVLSTGILKPIMTALGGLTLWGLGLAAVSLGGALPFAAATAAAGIFVAALKGLIDLGLFVWSTIRAGQLDDRNSRDHDVATNESVNRGLDVVTDGLKVGLGGFLGTEGGKQLSPNETVQNRFQDLKGDMNKDVSYTSMGGGKSTSVNNTEVGTDRLISPMVTGPTLKFGRWLEKKVFKTQSDKRTERVEHRTGAPLTSGIGIGQEDQFFTPDRTEFNTTDDKQGDEAVDRTESKFGQVGAMFGKLFDKASTAVSSVKDQDKDKLGKPDEDLKSLNEMSKVITETGRS